MEISLNLAWVLLTALMLWQWLRSAPLARADGRARARTTDRRIQFVALVMLLLILFPVISVTDDLQAIQNPAETDCLQRRGHACSTPHCVHPPVAAPPLPAFAALSLGVGRPAAPGILDAPVFDLPAMFPILNQPPPVA